MKKLLLVVSGLLLFTTVSAQTIVSTEVQKRNVVIEEYTGTYCGYCPLGHAYVNQFAADNPDRVVSINIHAGGYAAQYGTTAGNAILDQVNCEGFPALSLNRTVKNCAITSYTASSQNTWKPSAAHILTEESPVNIAATATVDYQTRVMNILVEVYYTKDVLQKSNALNIFLLQDNVVGEQHIYGANFNPEQTIALADDYSKSLNSLYRHEHMFRDIVTPQWGDTIASEYAVMVIDTVYAADSTTISRIDTSYKIPAGTFISKTYTYTIPDAVQDWCQYQGIERLNTPVEIADVDLAVFIADVKYDTCLNLKSANIYTGVNVKPTINNYNNDKVSIIYAKASPVYGCTPYATTKAYVRCMKEEGVNSLGIEFGNEAENDIHSYNFSGNIAYLGYAWIDIDEQISTPFNEPSTIYTKIISVNGQNYTSNKYNSSITHAAVDSVLGRPKLYIKTDKYGSEVTWEILKDGHVIQHGGPYQDGAIRYDTIVLNNIDSDGCYTFAIYDASGDGCTYQAKGSYRLKDIEGKTVFKNTKGDWGLGEKIDFYVHDLTVGLNEANENIYQSIIYPNPATNTATLSVELINSSVATINIVDIMGREVISLGTQNLKAGQNNIRINTQKLTNGIYYVRVVTDNGMTTNKLSIVR